MRRLSSQPRVEEPDVEWLLPYYWAAAVNASACGSFAESTARVGPDDLDLAVVQIMYGALVEQLACGVCAAPLEAATDVQRVRGFFTGARIVVDTYCRGARRHRHRATVLERAGDLQMGQLRPA
jgi:hypothetical protein